MTPAEFQITGELTDAAIDAIAELLLAIGEPNEDEQQTAATRTRRRKSPEVIEFF